MFFEIFEAWYFYYTGLLYCLYLGSQVLFSAAVMIYRKYKPIDMAAIYGENSYALITGATSGIGKQIAFSLCKRNINVILVSRDAKKLEQVRGELLKAYPRRSVITVQKDFKDSMKEGFHKDLYEQTKNYDISMIINNVGIGYSDTQQIDLFIERKDPAQILEMIYVNILSYTLNHFYFYNKLRQRTKCSLFFDVSSISAYNRVIISNIYSCTKNFNKYISNSLAYMNTDPKVHYLCFTPSLIKTALSDSVIKMLKTSAPGALTTEQAVETIFQFCGLTQSSPGHVIHAVFLCTMEFFMLIDSLAIMRFVHAFWRKNL